MDVEKYDKWSKTYEASIGGISRKLAAHLAESLLPPITPTSVILDNAAGPGIVTQEILKTGLPVNASIHVVDISPCMMHHGSLVLARMVLRRCDKPNILCSVMAAEKLDFPDDTFTHSITNISIHCFEDGTKGAREIYRTLKATPDLNSTTIVTCWASMHFAPILKEACLSVRPHDKPFNMPIDQAWFDPAHLEQVMRDAGFGDNVEMRTADFAIGVQGLSLLFEAFLPQMRAVLDGWREDEFDQFRAEFVQSRQREPV